MIGIPAIKRTTISDLLNHGDLSLTWETHTIAESQVVNVAQAFPATGDRWMILCVTDFVADLSDVSSGDMVDAYGGLFDPVSGDHLVHPYLGDRDNVFIHSNKQSGDSYLAWNTQYPSALAQSNVLIMPIPAGLQFVLSNYSGNLFVTSYTVAVASIPSRHPFMYYRSPGSQLNPVSNRTSSPITSKTSLTPIPGRYNRFAAHYQTQFVGQPSSTKHAYLEFRDTLGDPVYRTMLRLRTNSANTGSTTITDIRKFWFPRNYPGNVPTDLFTDIEPDPVAEGFDACLTYIGLHEDEYYI